MNRRKYRSTWLRLHRSYERRTLSIFRKAIKESVNVPWEQMDLGNYKMLLETNINDIRIGQAYFDSYFLVGSLYGKRVGRGINRDIKNFLPDSFVSIYKEILKQWLAINGGIKIRSVKENLVKYLIEEIQSGIDKELTIRQIAKKMQELVKSRNFYRWQALRIARTETTAAANYGASIAGRETRVRLKKVWVSAKDSRTRRRPDDRYDHWELDGKEVGEKELFQDGNAFLRFPGDPNAPAGTVINCRCTVALVPDRDANGRLVYI